MKIEGRRRRCADVLMMYTYTQIPHHLEMYGKDSGADIDEYQKIKRWSVRAT